MTKCRSGRRAPGILAACAAVALAGIGSARADVIESTPTLPLLGVPYTIPGGNCFPTAGFCVADGAFTLTSVVPGGFVQNPTDEDITTNATATIDLTTLSHVPTATVTLTGTIEQHVVGRSNPNDTGTWTADLVAVSLSGTLDTFPLTMGLNPADLAMDTGTTSITSGNNSYSVNSFFDVFAEITYDVPGGR